MGVYKKVVFLSLLIMSIHGFQYNEVVGSDSITVFCGSANKPAMEEIAARFEKEKNIKIIREGLPIKDSLKQNIFSGKIVAIFSFPEYRLMWFRIDASPREYDFEIRIPRYLRERHDLYQGKKVSVAIWEPNIILFSKA